MTRPNPFTRSVFILTLSLGTLCMAPVQGACASDPNATPPDACKVLSVSDVQPLLKKPIVKAGPLPAGAGCMFETANGSFVDIETVYGEGAPFAYRMGHTGPQGPKATLPLAGVGDMAKMAENGNGIVAIKGQVSCGASEGGVDWPRETAPARRKAQALQLGALCNKYFTSH